MTGSDYKKYTAQAKAAIKGEAFFEALISDYSIPHHIVGPKDIGIDYICEWVYGDKPTGILFAVQVKTISAHRVKLKSLGMNEMLNGLEKFIIVNPNLRINEKTLQYWRGFGMPTYLFAIIYSAASGHGEQLDCYYKRFTPVLTTARTQDDDCFYKVNEGASFLAFVDQKPRKRGFARDLFIDVMRCSYYRGSISYMSPRMLGLEQFPETDAVFRPLFEEYQENILITHEQTGEYINRFLKDQAIPSAAPPEEE